AIRYGASKRSEDKRFIEGALGGGRRGVACASAHTRRLASNPARARFILIVPFLSELPQSRSGSRKWQPVLPDADLISAGRKQKVQICLMAPACDSCFGSRGVPASETSPPP